ncbi:hypothetical protein PV336_16440 [Streptomyces sp. MI02-2A]|uniref:hypothetical protein n=1 Tax=Streptomyces sp. MI02-2A TaxID=3028688 RepID=UPI0029A3F68C|nr:hypothetical protein [Streptomyces sp. MI02-2A]MDX3260807.1 hypothetical protein [Streptomyces sp. MI02-2A]
MSDVGGTKFILTSSDLAAGALIPVPVGADLVKIYANLTTAGSTNTTVQVNKNGTAVTGAVATVASGTATKGNLGITNPYVGVNAGNNPPSWTDQNAVGASGLGPFNSSAGTNNVPALASFNAGDNVSVTATLGTSAAGLTYTLVFEVR